MDPKPAKSLLKTQFSQLRLQYMHYTCKPYAQTHTKTLGGRLAKEHMHNTHKLKGGGGGGGRGSWKDNVDVRSNKDEGLEGGER